MNEADTCRKYVLPKLTKAGWDDAPFSFTEQKTFTDGRIILERNGYKRGKQKRADYLLRYRRDFPIAVVEAKANYKTAGEGMQQAKDYAEILGLKFAYPTNGMEILEYDYITGIERKVDEFPGPEELWNRQFGDNQKVIDATEMILQPYYTFPDKEVRYYQQIAINRTIQAIAEGQTRILNTLATGTGKTIIAFQICWKLWNSKWNLKGTPNRRPKILFLADRNILVDDPKDKTFTPFGDARYKIEKGNIVKSREIYFAIYQAISDKEGKDGIYREFAPDFFDLIIVDECHRGSANDEGTWRNILEYFSDAVQVGMTATPLRDDNVDTYKYFGNPLCEYSLKDGISDGFLAPYRVYRVVTTIDATGWRPEEGQVDRYGNIIPDGDYGTEDFEKRIVLNKRTERMAMYLKKIMEGREFEKSLVFCVDQPHADEMRRQIANQNTDIVRAYPDYVCRVTSDEGDIGKAFLGKFQDVETQTPAVLTTSRLLSTGVDAPTVKNVILARMVNSMCEFKQIIGRGTRLRTDYGKYFFNIIDFTGSATKNFADPDFDGYPAIEQQVVIDESGSVVDEVELSVDESTVNMDDEPDVDVTGMKGQTISFDDDNDETVQKYYVDDIEVYIAAEVVYELDATGKCLNVKKYTDYAADTVRSLFPNASDLRSQWKNMAMRNDIISKLEERGIILDDLLERLELPDADPFDLICYLAYNSPLRTRRERAESLKKDRAEFFENYAEEARQILMELLDKYADYGLAQFKLPDVLKLSPIERHGNIREIAEIFGGPKELMEAIENLQNELYAA